MEVLDNDYIDEQSGEGLVVQHFDKLTFWQRLAAIVFLCFGAFFWWPILEGSAMPGDEYNVFFVVATTFTIVGGAILLLTKKQVEETKELTPQTIRNLFEQQSLLWIAMLLGVMVFIGILSYYAIDLVANEWNYATELKPPPPVTEEVEELIEDVLIDEQ